MSDAVIFVSVMEPFSGAPVTRIARAGMSCTEIVELCYSTQALAREWDDALVLYLGDRPLPREWWSKAKPKPGVLVALRPRPRWQTIGSWIYNAVQWMGQSGFAQSLLSAAISYGISALTAADPDSMAFDPRFSIDGARNDARPYASWPAVLGTHRVFPPQAAKAWTSTNGDKVWLHLLLGLGLAPIKLDPDSIQIGDTPLSNFSGASWGVREKPGDAIPSPWASISPDEQEGPGLVNQSDGWVTRTTDATDAERLQVELAWLEGLLRITSSGKHDAITVEYRLRYRKVGDEDWLSFATGAPSSNGALYSQHRATLQPFRVVHTRDGVDAGQYEIGFQRVTPDYDNPNIRTRIGWAKLRTFANAPPVIDDNLALLSVTVEAGPQLNNVVDRINCVISRVAPLWDGEEENWETADETSNPAALVRWIATGPGMAKPYGADGVDDAAFGAWFEKCVGMDWRCDMDVPTGASASPEDVMQMVARCGRATISRRGGKLVPILDSDQPHATQLFTPRNSWGLRARRVLPPETQAYRVQFNNADKNFVLDEMVVYFPGFNAGNITLAPELITVPGKTRAVEVNREAKRRIAEVLLRGMEYTFSADWENFASQRGQRVAFAHWDVAVGRISGRVKAIELNEAETNVVAIVLDEYATQTIGEDYAISWRRVDAADENPAPGMEVESLGVATTPGTSNRIELAAVGGVPIASAPKVGDLVTFGDAGIQTLDLVLGNLRRMSHYEAEISAAAYVDALYDDDDAPEPEWHSNVSGDAFPQPPAPQIMGVAAGGDGIFVDFDFPAATMSRVRGVETYRRALDDDDGRFEPVAVMGPHARLAAFPPGRWGEMYELLIVAIGDFGRAHGDPIEAMSAAAPTQITSLWQDDEPDAEDYDPGTYWFDTDDDNHPYQLRGGVWEDATGDALAAALLAAADATTIANGKNTTYFQTSAPSSPNVGDVWHDSDDAQRRTYRWSGSAWVAVTDQTAFNTAAAIAGQGALATLSTVSYAQMVAPGSSNLLYDPQFADEPAWQRSGSVAFYTTADSDTVSLGVVKSAGVAGNGTTSQTQASIRPQAALMQECVPGDVFYARAMFRRTSGFTGRLRVFLRFYEADKTTVVAGADVSLLDTDFRTTPSGSAANVVLEGTCKTPASAAYLDVRMLCDWSATQNNAGLWRSAYPALYRAVRLGQMVLQEDGSTLVSDAAAITSLGTAGAVAGQSALATLTPPSYAGNAAAYAAIGAGQLYTDTSDGNKVKTSLAPAAGFGVSLSALSDSALATPTVTNLVSISVTATATGGSGSYSYRWQQLNAGVVAGSANSPNSATTTFNATPNSNSTDTALFEVTAVDLGTGATATAVFQFIVTHEP